MAAADPSDRSDLVRLRHMLDAALQARSYLAGKRKADLHRNRMLLDAVVREIEIVGEAASRVSPGFRKRHFEVRWPGITGMRNRLIHAYFDVDPERVWDTVRGNIPELVDQLERILASGDERASSG